MIKNTFSYAIALVLLGVSFGCDYIKYGSDHSMCKYKEKGCKHKILARGISQDDIKAILETHNNYRKKVALGNESPQPKASNMREMKWSAELSTIAQRWADQCTFAHDETRSTADYEWVGQNVAYTGYTRPGCGTEFPRVIGLWYDEVKKPGFDPKYVKSFQANEGIGHYTQMVWALSDRVGCGFMCYKKKFSFFYDKIYVCNYGPGGNIISRQVYLEGNPASQCSNGVSQTYDGLCNS